MKLTSTLQFIGIFSLLCVTRAVKIKKRAANVPRCLFAAKIKNILMHFALRPEDQPEYHRVEPPEHQDDEQMPMKYQEKKLMKSEELKTWFLKGLNSNQITKLGLNEQGTSLWHEKREPIMKNIFPNRSQDNGFQYTDEELLRSAAGKYTSKISGLSAGRYLEFLTRVLRQNPKAFPERPDKWLLRDAKDLERRLSDHSKPPRVVVDSLKMTKSSDTTHPPAEGGAVPEAVPGGGAPAEYIYVDFAICMAALGTPLGQPPSYKPEPLLPDRREPLPPDRRGPPPSNNPPPAYISGPSPPYTRGPPPPYTHGPPPAYRALDTLV
eukprot:GHVT01083065.1.p1 GENE.GHVT01083065.1~~GHVT01083065.1.p1  ORF type:complete len:323 (+),score=8.42 GHVT01083065.1:350-1318(+)